MDEDHCALCGCRAIEQPNGVIIWLMTYSNDPNCHHETITGRR